MAFAGVFVNANQMYEAFFIMCCDCCDCFVIVLWLCCDAIVLWLCCYCVVIVADYS